MSSGVRCRARAKSSGRSRRVTSWASQARAARARASPALYQCRLLALTLPTTTLFRNTAPAAMSAAPGPVVEPPLPTPVRHTMPPAPMNRIDHLADTCAFDDNVRFEPDAGNAPRVVGPPEGADEFRLGSRINLIEDVNIQAALLPEEGSEKTAIGPAPVINTFRGSQKARWPTAATCSQALVTTVVGSRRTPRSPRELSTFIAYSGSIRQRSDMKPSICLMPRSVYWPLRHMSHSPTAQFGQGMGSGRRTIPTTRSPSLSPPPGPGSPTRTRVSWPNTRRVLTREAQSYLPSTISTSVPQTPTAMASTSTEPSRASGSGTSSRRAVPGFFGSTVIAFMA